MDQQWSLMRGEQETVCQPTWTQMQEALLALNGSHLDQVGIRREGQGELLIAGGDDQRYVVVYFPAKHPDDPSLTLTDPALGNALVTVMIQTPTEYEARYAVRYTLMLQVAQQFFQTGTLSRAVRWECDNTGQAFIWEGIDMLERRKAYGYR